MKKKTTPKRKTNPVESANIISFLTFFYTLDIFKKGIKKDLDEDDIYSSCEEHKSRKLGEELENVWNCLSKRKSTVYNLLRRCYGRKYLFLGVVLLAMQAITLHVVPAATKKLVTYFSPRQTLQSKTEAFTSFAIIIVMNIINPIFNNNYSMHLVRMGMNIRSAVSSLIYKKSLKLSAAGIHCNPAGKIVSLLTKDVVALENFVLHANYLWISPLELVITGYILHEEFGTATVVPMAFILLMSMLLVALGKLSSIVRLQACEKTDKRLQLLKETVTGIKTIKMYTWEHFFEDKISNIRRQEVYKQFQVMFLRPLQILVGILTYEISIFLQLIACAWFAQDLSAPKVYFALSAFGIVRYSVNVLGPRSVIFTSNFIAANKRISDFLNAEEIPSRYVDYGTTSPHIEMRDVTITLNNKDVLKDVSMELDRGLHVISGTAGSGKSTLLRTILQDYSASAGSVCVEGRISYAAQQLWSFPASIKENIIFGERYNEARYEEVMNICALKVDLRSLPEGDNTIVEDNGINLSRGQLARVNLARAVYRDSDIYLLDDPLCSLDVNVQNHIFNECIKLFLRDKICLMVSQDDKYSKQADSQMIMKEGRIETSLVRNEDQHTATESSEAINSNRVYTSICNDVENSDMDEGNEAPAETVGLLKKSRNIYHEHKKEGNVAWTTYHQFIKLGGGYTFAFVSICMSLVVLVSQLLNNKLIKDWADLESKLRRFEFSGETNSTGYITTNSRRNSTIQYIEYCLLAITVLFPIKQLCYTGFTTLMVWNVHKAMISRVIRARMVFFDTHLIGNILNRFSKDMATMEEDIPPTLYKFEKFFFNTAVLMIMIVYVSPFFSLPALVLCLVMWILIRWYLPAGRSLRRLEAATRAPLIGHLNASLEGATTIRAFRKESMWYRDFCERQDVYMSAYLMSTTIRYAFLMAIDMMCTLFIAVIIGYFLGTNSGTSAGGVGLAITKSFLLARMLQSMVGDTAELENQMTSVERALEYTTIEIEERSPLAAKVWSNQGTLTFEDVSLFYPGAHKNTLRNVNFEIKPNEKIAIIGRTGAGKSSILTSIFRLYDAKGTIMVNDMDVRELNLDFLRSNITIVPQNSFTFAGTIRDNVDPMGKHSDEQIWSALDSVGLKSFVPDLQSPLSSDGSLCPGHMQLLCFVRAVLQNNSILILDEVLANLDDRTSHIVQNIIDDKFKNCTVLMITHKLPSVLSYDKVMLLDGGELIEFGSPDVLVNDRDSRFYKIMQEVTR